MNLKVYLFGGWESQLSSGGADSKCTEHKVSHCGQQKGGEEGGIVCPLEYVAQNSAEFTAKAVA